MVTKTRGWTTIFLGKEPLIYYNRVHNKDSTRPEYEVIGDIDVNTLDPLIIKEIEGKSKRSLDEKLRGHPSLPSELREVIMDYIDKMKEYLPHEESARQLLIERPRDDFRFEVTQEVFDNGLGK